MNWPPSTLKKKQSNLQLIFLITCPQLPEQSDKSCRQARLYLFSKVSTVHKRTLWTPFIANRYQIQPNIGAGDWLRPRFALVPLGTLWEGTPCGTCALFSSAYHYFLHGAQCLAWFIPCRSCTGWWTAGSQSC